MYDRVGTRGEKLAVLKLQDMPKAGQTQMILDAGVLLSGFEPDLTMTAEALERQIRDAMADAEHLIGKTTGNLIWTCRPMLQDLEAGANRPADPEHMLLTGWQVTLKGRLTSLKKNTLAMMLCGTATQEKPGVTVLCPGQTWQTDNICWVGETTEGLLMIWMPDMICQKGMHMEVADRQTGTVAFEWSAFQTEGSDCPIRMILIESENNERGNMNGGI